MNNFYIVLQSVETNQVHSIGRAGDHPLLALVQNAIPQLGITTGMATPATAMAVPFEVVANEWFSNNLPRWARSYSLRLKGRMDRGLLDTIGARSISEIGPLDILETLRDIEKRDALETAKRVLRIASAIFRYGVATGRCQRDPTADLKGALKPQRTVRHRACLSAKELPAFLMALEGYGELRTKLALELIVLTFVRTSELLFAKWSEFEALDGPAPLWRIPAERMKMRRLHLVPLSPQAVMVLKQLRDLNTEAELLFAAKTRRSVISENTLLFALYRLGYRGRATVHGFRSTASTILNEAQFNRDWIESQLAHSDGSVRGVYNSAEWLPGRRKMMDWWAGYLAMMKAGDIVGKVHQEQSVVI